MKALVFSDSHGRTQPMLDAVDRWQPDLVFHLGDVMLDAQRLQAAFPALDIRQVAGNCDYFAGDAPVEGLARLEGKTFFFCHGHTLGVKSGLDRLCAKAAALGADAVLYGHTHRPLIQEREGLLVVNPGAVMDRRAALLTWEPQGAIRWESLTL